MSSGKTNIFEDNFVDRITKYLAYASANPNQFNGHSNHVKIILDMQQIYDVEKKSALELAKLGLPISGSRVGLVSQDPWIFVIRDALEFADGQCRLHTRVVNRVNNGVAILPFFDEKIVLLKHYRHPLQKTILEIPRGGIEDGDSIEFTAHKELLEELGATTKRLLSLGFVYGSTNLLASGAHLFFSVLDSIGSPQINEGIESLQLVTVSKFEELMLRKMISDGFTIAAYAQAKLRKLI